jgi:hypothetical protein
MNMVTFFGCIAITDFTIYMVFNMSRIVRFRNGLVTKGTVLFVHSKKRRGMEFYYRIYRVRDTTPKY